MSKSKFLKVYLEYRQVEKLISNGDCTQFVFQQSNKDDDDIGKKFVLLLYGIDINGKIIQNDPVELNISSPLFSIKSPKKTFFGNMVITKEKLMELFGTAQDNLIFTPHEYLGNYVGYNVDPKIPLVTYALDPSPPATPPAD